MIDNDDAYFVYFRKPHPDGRRTIEVMPLLGGRARLVVTDGYSIDNSW